MYKTRQIESFIAQSHFTFMLFLSSNRRFSGFKSRWQMEWLEGKKNFGSFEKHCRGVKLMPWHHNFEFLVIVTVGNMVRVGVTILIWLIIQLTKDANDKDWCWKPVAEIKGRDDLTEEPPRFLEIANDIFIIIDIAIIIIIIFIIINVIMEVLPWVWGDPSWRGSQTAPHRTRVPAPGTESQICISNIFVFVFVFV